MLATEKAPGFTDVVQMITKLYSAALRGVDALEVEVEVNARNSETPGVILVGKTLLCALSIDIQGF